MFGIVPKIQSRVCAYPFWPQWTVRWFKSETGPFTVFFFTPLMKWCISIANINDMKKPVEQVNTLQQCVITTTGALFTRMCFVVTPVSYSLALCNFCMSLTGVYQLYRKHNEGKLF